MDKHTDANRHIFATFRCERAKHDYRGDKMVGLLSLYCKIFAESQGTLLGNGATNASPRLK
jgi:hypothetical protein